MLLALIIVFITIFQFANVQSAFPSRLLLQDNYVDIKSVLNGKCLDVSGHATGTNGANIQIWDCLGNNAQKWDYISSTMQIKNIDGKCLDVYGWSTDDGANLVLWDCHSGDNQKWILAENGMIKSKWNQKCLDVAGWGTHAGANVLLWTCHGGANQMWRGLGPSSALFTRQEQRYDWIWDDGSTGSNVDGSFWKPKLNPGEAFLSFVNNVGWHEPTDIISTIITSYPENALREPIDYHWIWDDSGSGGNHDVWFFKPIPPINYICFGDFVSRSPVIHSYGGYKCIHKDYVVTLSDHDVYQEPKWNDRGSGADDDVQVIKISVNGYPNQYYRMRGSYSNTIPGPFYSFRLVTAEFTNMRGYWKEIGHVGGAGQIIQAVTTGITSTVGTSITDTFTEELSIAVSAGFAFEGVSASTTVTSTIAHSTANTLSKSLSQKTEETITVKCDSGVQYLHQFILQCDGAIVETHQYRCANAQYPQCGPGYFNCAPGDPNCNTCNSEWTSQ